MRRVVAIWTLATFCTLTGCTEEGKSFQVAESDVRQQLLDIRPPDLLLGGGNKSVISKTGPDGSVVWTVSDGFTPELRFTATIIPEDARSTRVAIDVQGASDDPSDPRNVKLDQNGDLRDNYKAMMGELVAAELENRTPDLTRFQKQFQSALYSHFSEVSASADRAAEASYKWEREDNERMERKRQADMDAAIDARRAEVTKH